MEKVEICCLKGVGPLTKPFKIIPLHDKTEVTIGRSDDCTVSIISNMISRKHAVLEKTADDKWTIMDNKSLNGIWVDNKKLPPLDPCLLTDGDTVQLGVKVSVDKPADFVWKFHAQLMVKKIKGPCPVSSSQTLSQPLAPTQNMNRKRAGDENCPDGILKQSPSKCKRMRLSDSPRWSPSSDMHRKLKEQEEKAQAQLQEQQEQLRKMQCLLAERDAAQEKMEEEIKMKEEEMKVKLEQQQRNLEEERKKFEEDMKQAYKQQLKDKEDSLISRLAEEKQNLIEEKQRVEANLQTEMERKLGKKDKDYQERLVKEKEKLDKIIEQKEIHQKLLETQLKDTQSENDKQKESVLQAKEDILSNFTELIETELQCSICSELFIQATSLNCSHSYCTMCIEQWMKVKKDCPQCRAPITSRIRSIVLDSYIDKMVEHLSEEMKEKRKELVTERKEEKERAEAASKPTTSATTATTATTRRGRGRGRGRARARTRGGRSAPTPAPAPETTAPAPETTAPGSSHINTRSRTGGTEPVLVSSDNEPNINNVAHYIDLGSSFTESDSESNSFADSDDDSEVEGMDGTYYGGYGSCFRCGSRGHWANGCPNW